MEGEWFTIVQSKPGPINYEFEPVYRVIRIRNKEILQRSFMQLMMHHLNVNGTIEEVGRAFLGEDKLLYQEDGCQRSFQYELMHFHSDILEAYSFPTPANLRRAFV